jgi:hypothetical protein
VKLHGHGKYEVVDAVGKIRPKLLGSLGHPSHSFVNSADSSSNMRAGLGWK